MELTLLSAQVPELKLFSNELEPFGFTAGTTIKLWLYNDTLSIMPINDPVIWHALCSAAQWDKTLGADWVNAQGELNIAGSWLTDIGISQLEQLDYRVQPGLISIRKLAI